MPPTDGDGGRDAAAAFFRPAAGGVGVSVRLTPKARREAVLGFQAGPSAGDGRCRVAVTAPPVDGRANAALLAFLARQWDVPRSSLSVAAGAGARDKVVHVAGDPALLADRLRRWEEANR